MERAASSGTIVHSCDRTTTDVIDTDNDNDGWPDLIELDRGSDIYDGDETPFNLYFGITTGIFYSGGLNSKSFIDYDAESFEISISAFMEIVFEELVIPLLLIPTYFATMRERVNIGIFLNRIENATNSDELIGLEKEVNMMVDILVLRNL